MGRKVVKQVKLNRPEQPCAPAPDYNFSQCVKDKVSKRVGCYLPWQTAGNGEDNISDTDNTWEIILLIHLIRQNYENVHCIYFILESALHLNVQNNQIA